MRGFSRWLRSSTPIDAGLKPCFSKSAYHTEELAKEVMERRQASTREHLRYYKCEICSFYHLTKSPLRETKTSEPKDNTEEQEKYKRKYCDFTTDMWEANSEGKLEKYREIKAARKLLIKEMKEKGYKVP